MALPSFSEERFPLRVAFGTSGGPERRTDVVRLSTGYEHRNGRHKRSVRRYDAGSGVKSLDDLYAVLAFFEARRGRLVGFRFRDALDWTSAARGRATSALDQGIGVGDGARTAFPLLKTYGTGDSAYARPIEKPVAGTVKVAVGGTALTAAFHAEAATGVVTLGVAPPPGALVSAGFEFDVPVRFDTDHLAINIAAFEAGDIPSIPLLEVRP